MDTMNAQRVKVSEDGKTLWIRIPDNLAKPVEGGCCCPYCIAHPTVTPKWDTIAVSLVKPDYSWTVHYPNM